MPTKSPRLLITVTEEQHALLAELGRLQRRSSASYLREMLDSATPLLREAVPVLRMASEELSTKQGEVDRALRNMIGEVRSLGDEAVDHLELLDQLPSDGRRRPKRGVPSASEGVPDRASADADDA